MLVANLVSPPERLRGYLQRFLHEPSPCTFVGGATSEICEDVAGAVRATGAEGFVAVSDFKTESGFRYLYFRRRDHALVEDLGPAMIEHMRAGEKPKSKEESPG